MDRSFWIGLFSGLALVAFLAISGLFSSMSGVGHGPGQHMMSEMPQGGMFSGMMFEAACSSSFFSINCLIERVEELSFPIGTLAFFGSTC